MVNRNLMFLILGVLIMMPFVFAEPIVDLTNYEINSLEDIPEGYHLEEVKGFQCYANIFKTPDMQNFLKYGLILVVIGLILKGFALWGAARKNSIRWFIALLLLSFAGILPLIYLVISRDKKKVSKK